MNNIPIWATATTATGSVDGSAPKMPLKKGWDMVIMKIQMYFPVA